MDIIIYAIGTRFINWQVDLFVSHNVSVIVNGIENVEEPHWLREINGIASNVTNTLLENMAVNGRFP